MADSRLFTAGSLFTTDYLAEAIQAATAYLAIDVVALRERLATIAAAFPKSHRTNESQTEDDLIWPVLSALGWTDSLGQQNLSASGRDDVPDGLLFIDADAKAAANTQPEQWRRYDHGAAVIESKRWARPLDRAAGSGETTAPSTQMLRYLRRIDDNSKGKLRWGILTNGAVWRLYWAGARSISEEFLEIDLSRVLNLHNDLLDHGVTDAERDHWLRVFATVFGREAFVKTGIDHRSFHDRARAEAAFYEERVADSLSKLVFEQVFPSLATAISQAAPDADLQDVRQAALVLLYRLLFILYAEDRDLLPVSDKRYDDYALRKARLDVGARVSSEDVFSATAARVWTQISDLSRIIDVGDNSVGIPPYNGGLFGAGKTPILDDIRIPDAVMAPVLDALSYERSTGERRYINYRDLSVQQLGSIYERLLEFELVRGAAGIITVTPNLFARKNSGSYYTPDELVGLILDETLEPLITERMARFDAVISGLDPAAPPDMPRVPLDPVDPAEAILKLKICDPAMGSGHFLVSLVDTLADHVLLAMAKVSVRGAPFNYQSPLVEKIHAIRATINGNATAENWTIDQKQLDDRHIVRRMVLKRCIYGVDKNPMAVELAKVSLWLHTFTVGAPLSFIDHHLRTGDSLFGLWVSDALEKAGRISGVKGASNQIGVLYSRALRDAEAEAAAMHAIEQLVDVEIAEAHHSAAMFVGIQSRTAPLNAFVSLLHALDWLDLKDKADKAVVRAWLDGAFGNPVDVAEGRLVPKDWKGKAADRERFGAILDQVNALVAEERFLNWQVTFPGVWKNWSQAARQGGFDAVVGNPPWDRIKLQQVEWFAARRPEIALAQKASDRTKLIAALKTAGDPLWNDYALADGRAADGARMARSSGNYPLLSRGDINLYSLFVERAHGLVKPEGIVGLLTPSGIASDLSASAFFRGVATKGHLKSLYDFENRRTRFGLEPFFPDVDSRFKFCAVIASPSRKFAESTCGFFLQSVDEKNNPDQAFAITAADFARVNPNTGTAPNFRTRRDMALTTAIYDRLPVLVNRSGGVPVAAWPVRYARMFDMTNDSGLFRTRAELETREGAWPVGGNRFQSAAGEWVPLYEGKMVQAFDHRAASVVVNLENQNRPAQPRSATPEEHADTDWLPEPQFWVQTPPNTLPQSGWVLRIKEITSPTNMRSMIAALFPTVGFGNKVPVLLPGAECHNEFLLVANFNSVAFDFVVRQKIQGQTLNLFILEQLPVVPPAAYARAFGPKAAAEIVRAAVLELTYTAHDMAPFARDMGYVDKDGAVLMPFIWNDERRLALRAKLDALYFILYGVFDPSKAEQSRDDIGYIYSTFPIVEREETAAHGAYRSRDLCLAWINALMAGQPDAEISG